MIQINDLTGAQLSQLGEIITGYQPYRDAFTSILVGRIMWTRVSAAQWKNALSMFKRGMMELGETIEDVYIDLARPFDFNPDIAEKTVFRREFPAVRVAFYQLNWEKLYKTTVEDVQLRAAFISWGQLDSFFEKAIQVLYTSMEEDEFLACKYILGNCVLNGCIHGVRVSDFTSNTNLGDLIATVKGTGNYMKMLKRDYNRAGVYNKSEPEDMYIILDGMLDARIDVNVLASAFNMDKATFIGHKVVIDAWSDMNWERLDMLFASDPNYAHYTSDEVAILDSVGAIYISRDFMQIYDQLQNMESIRNPEGRYWNYTLLTRKLFAVSPFENGVVFTKATFTVTGVEIELDGEVVTEAEASPGQVLDFSAVVAGTGSYNGAVLWSVSGANESGTYMNGGTLRVATNETATELTVTATSIGDPTQSATVTVTVS